MKLKKKTPKARKFEHLHRNGMIRLIKKGINQIIKLIKKYSPGLMDEWAGGCKSLLKIACSNQNRNGSWPKRGIY